MNNDVDEEDIQEVLSPLAQEERRRLEGEQEDEEQQMEKSPKMISRALEAYKNVLRENHVVDKVEEQYLGSFSSNIKFFTVLVPLSETNPMNHEEMEYLGKKMFQLLKHLEGKFSILGKTTLVGVTFESNDFEADSYLPIASKNRIKVKNIVEALTTLLQSHQLPTPIQKSEVKVTFKYFIPLSGSGKRKENQSRAGPSSKRARNEDDDDGDSDNEGENISGAASRPKQTRSNIMINNVDRDCLLHAVYQIWMQYQTLKEKNPEANKMRRAAAKAKKSTAVYEEVEKMKKAAGIRKSRDFTSEDLELLQNTVFKDKVQLIAIAENQESPFYIGPFLGHKKHITVLLQYINGRGHFSGVRSLSALMKTHFYCTLCLVKGPCLSMHYNCPKLCRRCGQEECQKVEGEIRSQFSCVRCRISFQSKECLDNHLRKGPQGGKSRCDLTEICKKCGNSYYTNKRKHKCGESWCLICEGDRPKEHDCKMEKSLVKENNLSRKRFVYTFESMVDPATEEHVPILFIGLNYCSNCSANIPENLKDAVRAKCDSCSMNSAVVINRFEAGKKATNVVKEAVEWMFSPDHKDFVGIAHNFSRYISCFQKTKTLSLSRHDAHAILNHIISDLKGSPDVVMNGSKVTCMKYKDVTLLDSHLYLKMSLEDVAKTFNIPTKRGYDFPVGFIHPNNFDYVGAIPPLSCYSLHNKTPAERVEFEHMLDERRKEGCQFNFAREFLKYGYKSVYILAKALVMFEKDFESITGVVIFEESSTPEAAAVKVFRRRHFDHKTTHIALDAPKSYYGKSSIISQKYLAWFEEENQVKVKRSSTTGEHKIKNYFVDGYVAPCSEYEHGLVIEFSGCHWHAHTCSDHGYLAVGKKSGETIRKADRTRLESLQEHHVVKVVTECQVNEMKKLNQTMAMFFEEFKLLVIETLKFNFKNFVLFQDVMDIVDASCGRTEVFKLSADNDQKHLHHVKIIDLYPFVLKNKEFPVGKPKVISRLHIIKHLPITKPDQISWRGFVSCRILPPRHLTIPMLEMKVGEKRIAALCFTCASRGPAGRSKPCTHSDRERSYTGSFTTAEVQKALQLGYVVTNVFQV
ncbi:hypothetical protein CAEBREN_29797 [Caenorhabditis brenneri]|uniref:DNA-directed DNA polymerase n=1 Tax=Caenorhabditis brenneri TaxID=135651 RepID=G0NUD9_CAEBE|nr:hypothetical protein CAEBREN_29797 [Caenorhabditis brenneri]